MDLSIINAIRYIKSNKKRPSIEAIHDKLRSDDINLDDVEFCETFKILERKEIVRNIKPKEAIGSYTVCEEMLLTTQVEETEKYLLNHCACQDLDMDYIMNEEFRCVCINQVEDDKGNQKEELLCEIMDITIIKKRRKQN